MSEHDRFLFKTRKATGSIKNTACPDPPSVYMLLSAANVQDLCAGLRREHNFEITRMAFSIEPESRSVYCVLIYRWSSDVLLVVPNFTQNRPALY